MTVRESRIPDRVLALALLLLLAVGVVVLASATHRADGPLVNMLMGRQLAWIGLGMALVLLLQMAPMPLLRRSIPPVYCISLILLLAVLWAGRGPAGRWLIWGSLRFQPAEAAKAATLLMLAHWLSRADRPLLQFSSLAGAVWIAGVPFVLVLLEPDLGTALVFAVLGLAVLIWRGLPAHWLTWPFWGAIAGIIGFFHILFFALLIVTLLRAVFHKRSRRFWRHVFVVTLISGMALPALWRHLPAYQKLRMESFLSADADAHGAGYQVIQSKIAIGSGGVYGKGFGRGTQTQLRFLPEHHTDFIFSALGEGFGLLGVTLALILWGCVLWRLLYNAERRDNLFERLFLFGLTAIWGFQTAINVAMTVGWAPVTGLPIPFFSYGGSAMVVNMGLAAVALKCTRR